MHFSFIITCVSLNKQKNEANIYNIVIEMLTKQRIAPILYLTLNTKNVNNI